MPRMRVADYLVGHLAAIGATRWFVLTGNGAMYLNDAIAQRPEISYICGRNEAAMPMMAEALARLTGRLGVVCVTSGPGSTNAIPGLAEAYVDSAPVLVLSGQAPVGQLPPGGPPAARPVRTFGTAGFDIIPAVAPMTKYAVTVRDPSSVRYHLEQALHLALSGRPGPVWLDLPMDVQSALIDPDTLAGFIPPAAAAVPAAASVSAVLALLRGAARPLLIAGQGVRQAGGQHRLRELVELLGAPLLLSRLGQDLLSHEHPLNFGQAGVKGVKYGPAMMAGADLIVALGCRLAVPLAGEGLGHFAPDARIVMIDVDPAELAAHGARLALPVQAEVSGFIAALIEAVPGAALPDWTGWTDRCAGWRRAQPMLRAEQRGDPIDLYHFMARLNALAPQDAVFITDAGSNYYVGGQVMTFAKPGQRELTSGTFAAMGLSIPLAIGAACADPDRPILAVTGDGSLELNIQELKTLSYYRLNVKLFVINNGGYLSMRNWQDSLFEGRRIGADDKTGAETLVLRKIADAFEMPYQVIAAAADIDATLTALLARPGPVFVEVVCDDRQRIVQPFAAEMADQMADQMAAEPTGAR